MSKTIKMSSTQEQQEQQQGLPLLNKGEIDFSKTQDHSFVERLYIGYMEPSLIKLSKEWNIPLPKLKEILNGKRTHLHQEFTFFGDIYFRDSINNLAPFKPSVMPFDIREGSEK